MVLKSQKLSVGKKVGCIIGITIASLLVIIAFSGRFCNTEGAKGFMRFANFFVGAFGMAFYGMMAAVIISCACALAGKTVLIPAKYIAHFILMFVAVVLLVHMLTTTYLPADFNAHMSYLYHYYDGNFNVPSFGGVVFGLFAWCLIRALTIWGACIVVGLLLCWTVYVAGDFFYKYSTGKLTLTSKPSKTDIEPTEKTAEATDKPVYKTEEERQRAAYERLISPRPDESVNPEIVLSSDASSGPYNYADRSQTEQGGKRPVTGDEASKILFPQEPSKQVDDGNSFFRKGERKEKEEDDYFVKGFYSSTPKTEEKPVAPESNWKISSPPIEETKREEIPKVEEKQQPLQREEPQAPEVPVYETVDVDEYDDEIDIADVTVDVDDDEIDEIVAEPPYVEQIVEQQPSAPMRQRDSQTVVDEQPRAPYTEPQPQSKERFSPDEVVVVEREDEVEGGIQVGFDTVTAGELAEAEKKVHQYSQYNIPPFDLLNDITYVEDHDDGERQRLAQAIVNKLAVFNIKIELADIIVGPSVTRYMFTVLSQKTRMSDFKQYSDDIKACVEAQEDIIIEAPVKGTNMVGIEVANKVKRPVVLRALLESPDFQEAKGNLVFAIGQEITGKVVLADLSEMPHLLIAGTTGSGKSVCLNCLIVSLMYKYGPEYLRFVMVDPKFVELSRYDGIPHMLTTKTITVMQDALACMDYLINEMEARYQLFRQTGVDKIGEYNKKINPKLKQKLPYLVFVVDELADLMATNKSAFEGKLMRLAQKARAAGIHIVLATQRPDTKVITGTIKANLPCRMALKVSSSYDSQTIIGGGGAEKLLGRGDMLFMNSTGTSELNRVQGAYVSNDEIRDLVKYSKEANEVYYDADISKGIFVSEFKEEEKSRDDEMSNDDGGKDELYPYYKKALRYWLERNNGKASISSIQRGINVGFNRAGRIMENLQRMGYVEELSSSETSNRALKVLVTLEELDDLFPDVDD